MWSAGGRNILSVKEAYVWCGDKFANPPANRKQAPVISLKKKQYGTVNILNPLPAISQAQIFSHINKIQIYLVILSLYTVFSVPELFTMQFNIVDEKYSHHIRS